MARIDWVRQRLEAWSRWCMQQDGGALGYPKQSAFARLGGVSSRGEATVPINSIEASETNQAVESLKMTQSHLYIVLTLTYAYSLPRHLVAKRMCRAESTVKRNLEDADHAVARWLSDRKLAREIIAMKTKMSCTTYTF